MAYSNRYSRVGRRGQPTQLHADRHGLQQPIQSGRSARTAHPAPRWPSWLTATDTVGLVGEDSPPSSTLTVMAYSNRYSRVGRLGQPTQLHVTPLPGCSFDLPCNISSQVLEFSTDMLSAVHQNYVVWHVMDRDGWSGKFTLKGL